MKLGSLLSASLAISAAGVMVSLSPATAEAASLGSSFSITNFTGDTAQVDFTLSDVSGGVLFDVEIARPQTTNGDLFGFFAGVKDDNVGGITDISGSDITKVDIGANSVINLGKGNNLNGFQGDRFDFGVTFGGPGLGGLPPITATNFTVAGLTVADFDGQVFGARLQSTGDNLDGSSKLAGTGFVGGTEVPEPITVVGTILAVGIGGLFQKKRTSQRQESAS